MKRPASYPSPLIAWAAARSPRRLLVAASLGLMAALSAVPSQARPGAKSISPPWDEVGLPPKTHSATVLKSDEPILAAPDSTARRRGSAQLGAALPIFAARQGPGCKDAWLQVGPMAWTCATDMQLTDNPPVAADVRSRHNTVDGLPFRYYFVSQDGSFAYRDLREADIGTPDMQLEPGFAVAVVEQQMLDGYAYGFTANQRWVPMRDLHPVRSTMFQGVTLPVASAQPRTTIDKGWVHVTEARVYHKGSPGALTVEKLERFTEVDILEQKKPAYGGTAFVRIGTDRWLRADDIRRPTVAPPPEEVDVDRNERWIDVELETQTLVAYEGAHPVFATMVSTGKGRQGTANETPKGTHRVWAKLLTSNMDNLEDEWANRYYRMESVPYVQYFSKGVGLHGVFWHRSFGRVRSHGCVNLTPLDAQFLFWWTGPRLPAGWTAVLPSGQQPGAVVRVR